MNSADFIIRPMELNEWHAVAALIHDSTNAWYQSRGLPAIFRDGPNSTMLFCEVYESLDPGCCLVAEDCSTGRLAGSCFYHPRPTHISLGIMNVHPDSFGKGVARQLLCRITDIADERSLPTRLISSAINLDSYSLYNRAGFVAQTIYQDVLISVANNGFDTAPPEKENLVRPATLEDVPAMVELEQQLAGISRQKDWEYFIHNAAGFWHTSVIASEQGGLAGFLSSIRHPASNMVGPGVMKTEADAIALVYTELQQHRGNTTIVLTPPGATQLVKSLYSWSGRNCELHVTQIRGEAPTPTGIVIPTFMPETG